MKCGVPLGNKSCSDAVVKLDLGALCGDGGGYVAVGGQEKVPVDQESGAGGPAVDCGHGLALAGENGGLHPLGLAHPFAETPRFSETSHG